MIIANPRIKLQCLRGITAKARCRSAANLLLSAFERDHNSTFIRKLGGAKRRAETPSSVAGFSYCIFPRYLLLSQCNILYNENDADRLDDESKISIQVLPHRPTAIELSSVVWLCESGLE